MTDIIEKAARDLTMEGQRWGNSGIRLGFAIGLARAVIRSLRDNTDSPRVCDELTRMLGEEG